MLKTESILKRKLKAAAFRAYHFLENNGNCNFEKNGEKQFLDCFLELFDKAKRIVVFDVGANVGTYSEYILNSTNQKGQNLEIHAFEPVQSTFKLLHDRLNNFKNVKLNNQGLSSSCGQRSIFLDTPSSSMASVYKRASSSGVDFKIQEQIMISTGDSYINKNKVSHIDLLKIDVEGHELEVLKGLGQYLNNQMIDFIQFEYGGANLDSRTSLSDFYDLLLPRGYIIAKIMPQGPIIRNYSSAQESFIYSNYLAISKMAFKNYVL